MTEFPALHDALVGAAARRRRRRRVVGATVPTFAVAVAALVALGAMPREPQERERPVTSPAPTVATPHAPQTLEAAFAVFRRKPSRADRLPVGTVVPGMGDPSETRFLKQGGPRRFFAASFSTREGESLCLLAVRRGRMETASCGTATEVIGESTPLRIGVDDITGLFLPDGSTDLRFLLANGTGSVSPKNGLTLVRIPGQAIAGTSWTGASGTRYIRYVGPQPKPRPAPTACPKALEPLPADALAKARRAALIAVDRLYPQAAEATVAAASKPTGTPCGAAIAERSIEVSLNLVPKQPSSARLGQGRLLAGMKDGDLRVVYVLR